ncbi:MAG: hypothetical protein JWO22_1050 [Frankiales bacterium]|nr:hypothetical protein [Frankiales bacterium]
MKLTDLDDSAEQQLRTLDQRFIAAAAPRVARAFDRAARTRVSAKQLVKDVDLRDLNALDEKYATRGPLGFFREVPQLMAVLVGIVFIVGTLAVAYDKEPRQEADQTVSTSGGTTGGVPTGGSLALGPETGSQAAAYLRHAATSLDQAATGAPDDTRFAMVSLSAYYRPELAASILSGYVVKRAWVHVVSAGTLAPPMLVVIDGDLAGGLKDFYRRQVTAQAKSASSYQQLADDIAPTDPQKADNQKYADLARAQSAAFRADCGCVYAFVVSATPTQLLSLRSRPGIRSIEVGPSKARIGDLLLTTLYPEVKGVVPNQAENVPPPS